MKRLVIFSKKIGILVTLRFIEVAINKFKVVLSSN